MRAPQLLAPLLVAACSQVAPTVPTDAAPQDAGTDARVTADVAAPRDAGVVAMGCGEVPPGAPPEIGPLRVAAGVGCVRDPHALLGPRDAIELADGTVLVTEMGGGRIARRTSAGWSVWATGLVAPIGLRALADGSVLVAEEHAFRVSRVRDGVRETVTDNLGHVTYLTLGPDGLAYVSSFTAFTPTGTVWRLDPRPGAVATAFGTGINVPEALHFDPDGTLLVGEWNTPSRVLRLPAQGGAAPSAPTVAAGFAGVYGVARLPSGALLVANHNRDVASHGEVVRIAPNGTRNVILAGIKTPGGITVTPRGDVLVTEFHGGGARGYLVRLTGL